MQGLKPSSLPPSSDSLPRGAVYCALVHHPVRDRAGAVLTSAVTNLDVHDIARSAKTFGLAGYFVVSPIAAQRIVVERILSHWSTGAGARRTPERSDALASVSPVASVEEAEAMLTERHGRKPTLVVTEARPELAGQAVTHAAERERLEHAEAPSLILFGTAHGLHPSLLSRADRVIEPIFGPTPYNHLSVRAAAAITFDRLFAPRAAS